MAAESATSTWGVAGASQLSHVKGNRWLCLFSSAAAGVLGLDARTPRFCTRSGRLSTSAHGPPAGLCLDCWGGIRSCEGGDAGMHVALYSPGWPLSRPRNGIVTY